MAKAKTVVVRGILKATCTNPECGHVNEVDWLFMSEEVEADWCCEVCCTDFEYLSPPNPDASDINDFFFVANPVGIYAEEKLLDDNERAASISRSL